MKPDLVLNEDDKRKRFKKYKPPEEAVHTGTPDDPNDDPNADTNYFESSDDEESRKKDFLEFVKETAGVDNVQKILSDLAENESSLDPETGMLMNSGEIIISCYAIKLHLFRHPSDVRLLSRHQ